MNVMLSGRLGPRELAGKQLSLTAEISQVPLQVGLSRVCSPPPGENGCPKCCPLPISDSVKPGKVPEIPQRAEPQEMRPREQQCRGNMERRVTNSVSRLDTFLSGS